MKQTEKLPVKKAKPDILAPIKTASFSAMRLLRTSQ